MVWLILGILIGAGTWWLAIILRARHISLKVYEWGMLAIAGALLLLGLQNLLGMYGEFEPRAGWLLFALFGIPAVVLIALVGWLAVKRPNAKPAENQG
jgi:hypothetical protein